MSLLGKQAPDDGVGAISQCNPKAAWAATTSSIRGQLEQPEHCP